MKTRLLIIIGIILLIIVSVLSYLQWKTETPSQLHCMFNTCSVNIGRTVYPLPDSTLPRTSVVLSSELESTSEPSDEHVIYSMPFGMTQEELESLVHVEPIYVKNPNNPDELILDIDSMIQVRKILDKCDYIQKLESGKISWRNSDGSFNVIRGDLPFFNNGTHYIYSNTCKWIDSLEAITYNCFEANPMEQNWYSGPNYFDNGTHYLDVQQCEWENRK